VGQGAAPRPPRLGPGRVAAEGGRAGGPNEEYEFLDAEHPLTRLLRDPNDPETGVSFWYEFVLFNRLCGESFALVVESDSGRADETELWVIPSHWVWPVCDGRDRLVDRFELYAPGGRDPVGHLEPEEVIWWKRPSPLGKLAAASPLQAMAGDVDTYEKITAARNFALDNGAAVGGTITVPPNVTLGDDTVARMEARFAQKYAGVFNFNRPIILEGGAVYTPTPAENELAFMQTADQLRKYVMAGWGLDEVVLGFSSVPSRAAAVAAIYNVNESTINPLRAELAAVLTEKLGRRFDERARIFWEDDTPLDPDAVRQDYTAGVGVNAVSANDYRTHVLGLEPYPEEVYDRPLVSPGLVNPGKDSGDDWDGQGLGGFGNPPPGGGVTALSPPDPGGAVPFGGDADLTPANEAKTAKVIAPPVDYSDPAPYGYCPECRAPGVMAERRPDGNATCAGGHEYPRKKAKYASTQVELTGSLRRKLLAIGGQIEDADLGDDGREEEPHVTVRYGLHADSPAPVAELVRGFGPVSLTVGRLNAFRGAVSGKDYDVIYAEVDSPDLHRLNKLLADLPHTDTHPAYVPHACVGYVKAGLADKYLTALAPVGLSDTVPRLTFSTAGRERTVIPLAAAKHGPPPRPGLVWDEQSHHWVRPDKPGGDAAGGGLPDPDKLRDRRGRKLDTEYLDQARGGDKEIAAEMLADVHPDDRAALERLIATPPEPEELKPAEPKPEPAAPKNPGNDLIGDAARPDLAGPEVAAVKRYTSWDYGPLNKALRRDGAPGSKEQAETHAALQSVFAKVRPLPEPVTATRALSLDKHGLPAFLAAVKDAHAAGTPFTHAGYVSTSVGDAIKPGKVENVILTIKASRGLDLMPYSDYAEQERELLLNHGSRFKVTGVEHKDGRWHVTMDQLPDDTPDAVLGAAKYLRGAA
jgi:hypothetical protein